ncbi:beta-ketoacyl-ACP synthase III [Hyphobacterium sp. HN65]|uniref:Beta-ketoacyl-[acyl-carrier-protein] synthase III n=1 Tax=Hyphobacterium lacteum TaxID=3116575 RepID=A0ABU7LMB3_9PROT|nr:beta-ketoacyl-ACP synthase III [Hyphobacterium sp. HN65]MEE2525013.1 beta-ketoacyl-ACP synthase III [Hyphobacterium sp. HN65]
MTRIISRVAGQGAYLPERVLTNAEISTFVDTSDEWIQARTGIRERHVAADGETTADLGHAAALAALADAGCGVDDIDLIVVATTTPDLVFPSTAALIQNKLDMRHGAAFDVQAVCSGFVYALAVTDGLLKGGVFERALVIGAETMSRILNWEDRTTCVLFGDGAGAWVLERAKGGKAGLVGYDLRSEGRYSGLLKTTGGVSSTQSSGVLTMEGPAVFKHAVTKISNSMERLIEREKIAIEEIDWFVPHQANQRILEGVADKLKISRDKVISTVAQHGNTSAASVPLAFHQAVNDGRIKRGDLCLLEALGGGLTWGSALVRF